jgi:hypothetical protein
MPHGNAISLASKGVVRVETLAWIAQIILIMSVVSNDMSILAGGEVNARRGRRLQHQALEGLARIVEVCESALTLLSS